MEIEEYKYQGQTAYRGIAVCVNCQSKFKIETTDKEVFNNAQCFKCFMSGKVKPERKNPIGFL